MSDVDLTPPEEITPAECDWPTEPDDAGVDHEATPGPTYTIVDHALARMPRQLRSHPLIERLIGPATLTEGTSPLVTRAEWGARQPTGRYGTLDPHPMVTYHYEGPKMGAYDHARCVGIVQGIQKYHMDGHGWLDIAYNALVCRHGSIYVGRGPHNRSAANGTNPGNQTSYAVCYIAGVGDPLTDEAKRGLLDARHWLQRTGGATDDVEPHSHWLPTGCPGDIVRAWISGGLTPPPGYSAMADPTAPIAPPNGGNVLDTPLTDAIGFIDDPTSDGGWLVTKGGGIFTKAPANFYGSLGATKLNAPIAAFLPTPTGKGYWLFGEDGGVFNFGDAPFNGTYGKFADEYRAGIHKVVGAYFRGDKADPKTWRYSLVSNKLESYDI